MLAHKKIKIGEDVLPILQASTITNGGKLLVLPPKQLPRDQYERVAAVLTALGGKWSRSAKGFVFADDVRDKFEQAKSDGSVLDEKKAYEAFYTPPDLVTRMIELADLATGMSVLEPSAGDGRLAVAARDAMHIPGKIQCQVTCVEIRDSAADVLADLGFRVHGDNFLELNPPGPESDELPFDRIVMNPPFSNGADIDHVSHALKFLKPTGRLVAIMSAGVKTASTKLKKVEAFYKLLEGYEWSFRNVPDGSFKESGTNVRVTMLVASGPKYERVKR